MTGHRQVKVFAAIRHLLIAALLLNANLALAENTDITNKPGPHTQFDEILSGSTTQQTGQTPAPLTGSGSTESLSERTDDFIFTLDSWAKAWASKDADAYFKYYHADFKGQSIDRKSWEKLHLARVKAPQPIKLKVSHAVIKMPEASTLRMHEAVEADVNFDQSFQQGSFCESGKKHMIWKRASLNSPWLIELEDLKKMGGC